MFNIATIDDPAQRTRLGNRLWQFTLDRGSITVAPAYRITDDPRIRFKAPAQHNLAPQDPASGAFFIQDKYATFNAPLRLASKLEADYKVRLMQDHELQFNKLYTLANLRF